MPKVTSDGMIHVIRINRIQASRLQCFQKWINLSPEGQWLIISTHAVTAMVNVLKFQTFKLPAKKAKTNSEDPDEGLPC